MTATTTAKNQTGGGAHRALRWGAVVARPSVSALLPRGDRTVALRR